MSDTTSSLVFGQGSLTVMANVSSTFCLAKELTGTKAMELHNLISETLILKGVSFDKLVAQTYDGALNMKEALYVLFSKTQRIHDLFETVQREKNLKVLSIKRLNTVRWHSC